MKSGLNKQTEDLDQQGETFLHALERLEDRLDKRRYLVTKQFGQCRDLFISSLLAMLIAFLLMGCSMFNSVTVPLDIDALLGTSAEDFDSRLKEMADARLISEEQGQHLVRIYEIVLADTDQRPRVEGYFKESDARARRVVVYFDRYVRKPDALEWLGFAPLDLIESSIEHYTWEARTAGRWWYIYQVEYPSSDITLGSVGETKLCFIDWGTHNFSRETFVKAWCRGR